jgi:hypothetical protein
MNAIEVADGDDGVAHLLRYLNIAAKNVHAAWPLRRAGARRHLNYRLAIEDDLALDGTAAGKHGAAAGIFERGDPGCRPDQIAAANRSPEAERLGHIYGAGAGKLHAEHS